VENLPVELRFVLTENPVQERRFPDDLVPLLVRAFSKSLDLPSMLTRLNVSRASSRVGRELF
jgi:hypothetical protein